MQTAIIVFPGSNCERDVAVAFAKIAGRTPTRVWHGDSTLPKADLIVLPGGFSYGDYLRTGAMAAHSPIMRDVVQAAKKGVRVLGICNGFQMLTESGLLPGVLLRNHQLKFICRTVAVRVEDNQSCFTTAYQQGQTLHLPIAHGDGNYFADSATLAQLEADGQVALRYQENPNGSLNNIAGLYNKTRTILGLMPHPERAIEPLLGGADGAGMFESLARLA